ncbi:endonuclease [Rhodococcoides kyotonense]|uniref:Endonuclease n=1 Tax=Rhodococcoides kyotonense TaxID=398843 RepID=A0A177YMH6_9NOCA|nr:endonuclease [Rhodococcus kyotonensis]OAK56419.1 endonuclease [Rhodococcus kyotonensis]
MTSHRDTVDQLMADSTTYAEEADITLHDKPSPLFELLVLSLLLSTRISASIAVAAARELWASGYRTPKKMADAGWQDLVDALGRGHYKRYDESTATRLQKLGARVGDEYGGDLRGLAEKADGDVGTAKKLIQEFEGIGPTGSDIFLREVQDVWPWVGPYFDEKTLDEAKKLGLPTDRDELAGLVPKGEAAAFAAALIREALR